MCDVCVCNKGQTNRKQKGEEKNKLITCRYITQWFNSEFNENFYSILVHKCRCNWNGDNRALVNSVGQQK